MIRTLCRGTALYDDRRRTNLHHVGDSSKIQNELGKTVKVALHFSGVNFVSLNFIDYVSMALCMGDNRVGDTSDLLDLPQEVGLGRRGSF